MHTLWKTAIIIKRDFLEEFSYRFAFLLELSVVLLYTCTLYFIARTFNADSSTFLEQYGGDYFSFVLIGLALFRFLSVSLTTFASTLRNEQVYGTLEAVLSTPTPLWLIFLSRLVWNFLYGCLHLVLYFVVGILLLKASYPDANILVVPVILIISIIAFNALGMISASFIMVFKRGDPLNIFLGVISAFLGGAFFPVEVMPQLMQKIAAIIPITYTLRLMRDALINGATLSQMKGDFAVLSIMCAILVPAGMFLFGWSIKKAKRDGTLAHY